MRPTLPIALTVSLCALAWSSAVFAGGPVRIERFDYDDAPSRRSETTAPPKPAPLPDVIPYRGGPVLPGYTLRDHEDYLTTDGWTAFGLGYAFAVVGSYSWAVACEEPSDERGEGYCAGVEGAAIWTLLPVGGPGLLSGELLSYAVQGQGTTETAIVGTLYAIDTVAQVSGIVMIVAGAFSPSQDMVKIKGGTASRSSWYARPVMFDTTGAWGGMVGGRF